jgi:hypothetical protein
VLEVRSTGLGWPGEGEREDGRTGAVASAQRSLPPCCRRIVSGVRGARPIGCVRVCVNVVIGRLLSQRAPAHARATLMSFPCVLVSQNSPKQTVTEVPTSEGSVLFFDTCSNLGHLFPYNL